MLVCYSTSWLPVLLAFALCVVVFSAPHTFSNRDLLQTRASPVYIQRLKDAHLHLQRWANRHSIDLAKSFTKPKVIADVLVRYIQECYNAKESFLLVRHVLDLVEWPPAPCPCPRWPRPPWRRVLWGRMDWASPLAVTT